MSEDSDKLNYVIRLLSVTDQLRKLIPHHAETEHELRFLEINGRASALEEFSKLWQTDSQDVKKLVKNLRLQLGSKKILRDRQKVQIGKRPNQKDIIEIKANRGHSRLFAFFSLDGSLIICTHAYWKTSGNRQQQDREFDKAARLRELYLEAKEKKGENNGYH